MKIGPFGDEFYADRRTDDRTERHDEAKSHLSRFFERAQKNSLLPATQFTLK